MVPRNPRNNNSSNNNKIGKKPSNLRVQLKIKVKKDIKCTVFLNYIFMFHLSTTCICFLESRLLLVHFKRNRSTKRKGLGL